MDDIQPKIEYTKLKATIKYILKRYCESYTDIETGFIKKIITNVKLNIYFPQSSYLLLVTKEV